MTTNKREISLEFWIMTFLKWIEKVKEALSAGEYSGDKRGYSCGYCLDCDDRRRRGVAQYKCLIFPDICNASNCHNTGKEGYFEKWSDDVCEHANWPEALKYALLILKWLAKEGRRLGYMNDEREQVYKNIMEEVKAKNGKTDSQ